MVRTDKQIILVKYSSLAAQNTRIMWACISHWLCSAPPKYSVEANVKPWFGGLVLQEPWTGWGSVSAFSIVTLVCWGRKCTIAVGRCGEEPGGEGVNVVTVPWPHAEHVFLICEERLRAWTHGAGDTWHSLVGGFLIPDKSKFEN